MDTDGRTIGYTGEITNLAGALFDIQCDQTLSGFSLGATIKFSNAGTLRKSGGIGTTAFAAYLENSGTVQSQAGILRFSRGTNLGGAFQAAVDATINFTGASVTIQFTPDFQGPGTVQILTSTVILNQFNGTLDLVDSRISGEIASGGIVNLLGGSLPVNTSLSIQPGGQLNLSGPFNIKGAFSNSGLIRWQSGDISIENNQYDTFGSITNAAGGIFEIRSELPLTYLGGAGSFENLGILRKSLGTGITEISTYFNNCGTVEVEIGKLRLSGGINLGGTFQTAENGQIDLAGNSLTLSTTPPFQGAGIAQITATNVTLENFTGSVDLTGSQVSGQIAAGGILNLHGGSEANLSVSAGGIFNILGTMRLYGTLTNAGTVNWQDGDIIYPYISFQGTLGDITNEAGGLFDIRCDRAIYGEFFTKQFINAGTLRKSTGTGTTEFSAYLDNSGTVEGLTGTVRFNSGTNLGGTFQAAADAVVDVAGSTLTLASTPPFQGPGTVRITAPNIALENFTGSVDLTGSQVSGQIAAGGILNLHGGSEANLSVAAGGIFNILGTLRLYGTLTNAGTVNWQDGDIIYPYVSFQGTLGDINNEAGGLFDIRCDRAVYGEFFTKQFVNAGTLRKTASSGTTEFSAYLDNSGTVEGLTGTIRFNSGTNLGGTFQAAANAVVDIAGSTLTLASTPPFQGPGTVRITTPNVVLENFTGSVNLTNKQVSGQIAAGGVLNLQGGSEANLSVATGGIFNILGTLRLYGTLTNAGTVNWQDGDIIYPYVSFQGTLGDINNEAGGLFDIRCDRAVYGEFFTKQFVNAGTLRKTASSGTTEFSAYLDNSGTVEGLTGTLRFNSGYAGTGNPELLVTLSENMPVRIWIAGSTPATLAGKLTVQMEDGYRPSPGDVFPAMTYPGALGDFTCINGLDLGNGLRLEPQFDGEGLKFVATPYVEAAIPALHIIRSNQGVAISWPNGFSEWELYRSADFAHWQPTTVAGINNTVKPVTGAKEFFRLQKQE